MGVMTEKYAATGWRISDILPLRNGMSEDEAISILISHEKEVQKEMQDSGLRLIGSLLQFKGQNKAKRSITKIVVKNLCFMLIASSVNLVLAFPFMLLWNHAVTRSVGFTKEIEYETAFLLTTFLLLFTGNSIANTRDR